MQYVLYKGMCNQLQGWWKLIILSEELVKLTESSWAWRMKDGRNWLIWKDPDAGKDWRQEEMGTTGWDGWMAAPTQWTWVWVNSGSWGWTGRPDVLRFMGRKESNTTERLNWTELKRGNAFLPKWTKARRCGSTYLMETSGDIQLEGAKENQWLWGGRGWLLKF